MRRFQERWSALEARFKRRAEYDGRVYLPNPAPSGPVNHVLIAMEPSLGRWSPGSGLAQRKHAQRKIDAGFRNFLYSTEDFLLHYAIRKYLCARGETYHITDMSKGAMRADDARQERPARYDRWYDLLQQELELLTKPWVTTIWAIGNPPHDHLRKRGRCVRRILHYSRVAAVHRRLPVVRGFARFRGTVKSCDVHRIARIVLDEHHLPWCLKAETLQRLQDACILSHSNLALLFNYKTEFER